MSRTKSWKSSVAYVALALAGLGQAGVAIAAVTPSDEGLPPVASAFLDEIRIHPQFDPAGHRRVLLEPAKVALHSEWLRDATAHRATTRRMGEGDVRSVVRDAAAGLDAALREAFVAQGYEIVTAAHPGVLRVMPAISELYVNAVEAMFDGVSKVYVREAGTVVLTLDVRDATNGQRFVHVRHRDRATLAGGFVPASDVTTRYAFDGLYRRWSADCVRALGAPRAR